MSDTALVPVRRLRHIDASRVARPTPPRLKPRGIPPALEQHEVFTTDSTGMAARLGTEIFGRHRLAVPDVERDQFQASLHAVRLRDITLGYLDFVSEVDVIVDLLPDDYSVFMPMNGESYTENRGRRGAASPVTAVLPHPGTSAHMHWASLSPHLVVMLSADALHLHLSRLLGRSLDHPIDFDLELDMWQNTANRWSSAIQLLHTELFHEDSLLHTGIGLGPLEEFVMSALLYGQPSNYSAWLERPDRSPGRRSVRAAIEFIEQHLAEQFTVADIAHTAQCSVRSLQEGFREELQTTPWSYIRDRRLDRARADLLDAIRNDGTNVTDVALRWGFTHLGRFASLYRRRFGEPPSQTLRS